MMVWDTKNRRAMDNVNDENIPDHETYLALFSQNFCFLKKNEVKKSGISGAKSLFITVLTSK